MDNYSSVFTKIPRKHINKRAIQKGSYENSRLTKVKDLDLTNPDIRRIPRAGILFYTYIDSYLYICFGQDRKSQDLTDFGGTRRRNENPIRCAVRECNEESRLAFGRITTRQVQECCCLYSSKMLIIFVPVVAPNGLDVRTLTWDNFVNKNFLNISQSNHKSFNEVSIILWLGEQQIKNLFSEMPYLQVYNKVRRFIYSCRYFSSNIDRMKRILFSVVENKDKNINKYCNQLADLMSTFS